MKTNQELFGERLNRILTAVALGKPDRTPVVPCATAFCANHLGVKMSEFAVDVKLSNETILKSFASLGEIDGIQQVFFYAPVLTMAWLGKVQLPGKELPEGSLWQMEEAEMITPDDYDQIINKGYNAWVQEVYFSRFDNIMSRVGPALAYTPTACQKFAEAGIVPLTPATFTIPFEGFCGGRTMAKFTKDLFRMPDKVQAAMDVAMIDTLATIKQVCSTNPGPIGAWIGGWRSASSMISPKLWNRFVWPYYKKVVETVIEAGVIPWLHLDANWERDLAYFRELPKGKCIFAPDGATNIFKVKEVLGDHMCIAGDVPAALFAVGTPDDVYQYSTKLIREIGPAGFIMASGCDIPATAKPENVAAMLSACTGK